MRHIAKKVIAVSFALPEMRTVFDAFFAGRWIEVFEEFQDDHFAHLKFACLAGQKYAIARNVAQQALTIFGQSIVYGYPVAHAFGFIVQ